MGIILWIVFGSVIGWTASAVMKIGDEQWALTNTFVGVVGAVVGGLLVSISEGGVVGGLSPLNFFVAVLGAGMFIALFAPVNRVSAAALR